MDGRWRFVDYLDFSPPLMGKCCNISQRLRMTRLVWGVASVSPSDELTRGKGNPSSREKAHACRDAVAIALIATHIDKMTNGTVMAIAPALLPTPCLKTSRNG